MTRWRRLVCRLRGHPFSAVVHVRSNRLTVVDLSYIEPGTRAALRDLVYRCPRCRKEWTASQPVTVLGQTVYI